MYTNLTFDQFADYAKENNSAILQPLILQIRDFYRKIIRRFCFFDLYLYRLGAVKSYAQISLQTLAE